MMPQFFIQPDSIKDGRCIIRGDDAHHLIRVRKIRAGECVHVRYAGSGLIRAKAAVVGEDYVECVLLESGPAAASDLELVLCAGLIKGDKFDLVIQKSCEIGVSRIVPVITERTVPLPGERAEKKCGRWNRIAHEAAKQCLRPDVPRVEEPRNFADVIGMAGGVKIIAHTSGEVTLREFLSAHEVTSPVTLLVGPEGGFSDAEIDAARVNGWTACTMGSNQLRAETAAIVLPAIIFYEWG